jgi:hypothetical protein
MSVAAYSRNTLAGIARKAQERRLALVGHHTAPEPEIEPVVAPEPSKPIIAVGGKRYVFTDENVITFPQSGKAELRRVIGLVARMHGVTYDQIMNNKRRFFDARMAAICAVVQIRPDMTLNQLGKLFGRDHTSVINAMQRRGFAK